MNDWAQAGRIRLLSFERAYRGSIRKILAAGSEVKDENRDADSSLKNWPPMARRQDALRPERIT